MSRRPTRDSEVVGFLLESQTNRQRESLLHFEKASRITWRQVRGDFRQQTF